MSKEDLITALEEVLDKRSKIDSDIHQDHHVFIGNLLERQKRRQELVDKVKAQTWAWGLIAFLGWIGTVVYKATIEYIKHSIQK